MPVLFFSGHKSKSQSLGSADSSSATPCWGQMPWEPVFLVQRPTLGEVSLHPRHCPPAVGSSFDLAAKEIGASPGHVPPGAIYSQSQRVSLALRCLKDSSWMEPAVYRSLAVAEQAWRRGQSTVSAGLRLS